MSSFDSNECCKDQGGGRALSFYQKMSAATLGLERQSCTACRMLVIIRSQRMLLVPGLRGAFRSDKGGIASEAMNVTMN